MTSPDYNVSINSGIQIGTHRSSPATSATSGQVSPLTNGHKYSQGTLMSVPTIPRPSTEEPKTVASMGPHHPQNYTKDVNRQMMENSASEATVLQKPDTKRDTDSKEVVPPKLTVQLMVRTAITGIRALGRTIGRTLQETIAPTVAKSPQWTYAFVAGRSTASKPSENTTKLDKLNSYKTNDEKISYILEDPKLYNIFKKTKDEKLAMLQAISKYQQYPTILHLREIVEKAPKSTRRGSPLGKALQQINKYLKSDLKLESSILQEALNNISTELRKEMDQNINRVTARLQSNLPLKLTAEDLSWNAVIEDPFLFKMVMDHSIIKQTLKLPEFGFALHLNSLLKKLKSLQELKSLPDSSRKDEENQVRKELKQIYQDHLQPEEAPDEDLASWYSLEYKSQKEGLEKHANLLANEEEIPKQAEQVNAYRNKLIDLGKDLKIENKNFNDKTPVEELKNIVAEVYKNKLKWLCTYLKIKSKEINDKTSVEELKDIVSDVQQELKNRAEKAETEIARAKRDQSQTSIKANISDEHVTGLMEAVEKLNSDSSKPEELVQSIKLLWKDRWHAFTPFSSALVEAFNKS